MSVTRFCSTLIICYIHEQLFEFTSHHNLHSISAGFESFESVEIISPAELGKIGDLSISKSFDDAVGLSKNEL